MPSKPEFSQIHQIPGVFWTTNLELEVTWCGGQLATLEHTGRPIQSWMPAALEAHQQALRGEHASLELEWAGQAFSVQLSPLRDEQGKLVGVAGNAVPSQRSLSEAQFSEGFEQIAVGAAICDLQGGFLRVNCRFCEITGYSNEELQRVTFREITHPDDLLVDLEHYQALLAGKTDTYSLEKRYIRRSGEFVWVHLTVSALRENGVAKQLLAVVDDIDERKAAEATAAHARYLLELVFANAHGSMALFDRDFVFVKVNQQYAGAAGFEIEDLVGKGHFELFPNQEAEAIFQKVVTTGEAFRVRARPFENPKLPEQGTTYWDWSLSPIRGASGEVEYLLLSLYEVTQLKRAERERKRSEERYRSLLETIPHGIVELDTQGAIQFANPTFLAIHGLEESDIRAFPFRRLMLDDGAELTCRLERLRNRSTSMESSRERHRGRGGEPLCVQVETSARWGAEGEHLGYLGVVTDISEQVRTEEALAESQEMFSRFMEHSPLLAYIKDENRRYVYLNPICEATARAEFGVDMMGKTGDEVVPPELVAAVRQHDYDAMVSSKPVVETVSLPDGSRHLVNIKFAIPLPSGRRMLGGLALDITERVRAEEEVRRLNQELEHLVQKRTAALQKEQRFTQSIFETQEALVLVLDLEGKIERVNRACERKLGTDIIGRYFWQTVLSASAHDELRDIYVQPRFQSFPHHSEMLYSAGDGTSSLLIAWSSNLLRDEQGEPQHIIVTGVDITERKRVEDELQAARTRLSFLLKHAPAVIYATGREGLTFVSENVERLLGYRSEQITSSEDFWDTIVHPEDRAERHAKDYYRVQHADGSYRWLKDSRRELPVTSNGLGRIVGLWQDVSELVEMEQELERTREELASQQKLATVGQLTATVSHELRNPLGTIRTSVYTLRERLGDVGGSVERALARIDRNVVRCDNIITDLLDFSRTRESRPDPTHVESWLQELLAEQPECDWLELTTDFEVKGLVLQLDQDRLRRAVINVVENAIQAMESTRELSGSSSLTVGCHLTRGQLRISVKDNGPGMTAEVAERAFEPLYSTKTYGVGLGLPTVKQIMAQEGGGIELVSTLGVGTEVVLWLPTAGRIRGAA